MGKGKREIENKNLKTKMINETKKEKKKRKIEK